MLRLGRFLVLAIYATAFVWVCSTACSTVCSTVCSCMCNVCSMYNSNMYMRCYIALPCIVLFFFPSLHCLSLQYVHVCIHSVLMCAHHLHMYAYYGRNCTDTSVHIDILPHTYIHMFFSPCFYMMHMLYIFSFLQGPCVQAEFQPWGSWWLRAASCGGLDLLVHGVLKMHTFVKGGGMQLEGQEEGQDEEPRAIKLQRLCQGITET